MAKKKYTIYLEQFYVEGLKSVFRAKGWKQSDFYNGITRAFYQHLKSRNLLEEDAPIEELDQAVSDFFDAIKGKAE